jgi:hypothetical protein
MNRLQFFFLFIVSSLSSLAFSQDTLPKFSVVNVGNDNMIISWVNNYESVKQISIQTSHDSLKNFRTIISLTDPNAKLNGYADTKALNDHMYYRLFVVLGNSEFFYTESKQPVRDTANFSQLLPAGAVVPQQNQKPDFVPSFYVYTNKDGYVFINLPDADHKKYRIKFFEEDDSFLFELKSIKETGLTLDKANFLHAGWFKFELYNDEKLVERNRFYLTREF